MNNVVLLRNLLDDIIRHPKKFWVQVLSQKYLEREIFPEVNKNSNELYIWRGILKRKKNLGKGFQPQLGLGDSLFWYHNWLGSGKLCNRVPFVHICDTQLHIHDVCRSGFWNFGILYTILPPDTRYVIIKVDIPMEFTSANRFGWKHKADGLYTTTSPYHLLKGSNMVESAVIGGRYGVVKSQKKLEYFSG
ncbi:unnamed protein product [Vicia faba]|uniref:Uncharacterized protein n=1 Tax=Vicia faba TaxID=3906 RepID=A0AAV1A295_VICFA|nr:unnamed protein product [Vicia faba]